MRDKNIQIIIAVVISVLVAGEGVYLYQQSILEKIENELRQQIDDLHTQLNQTITDKDALQQQYVKIISPNGGENLCLGDNFNIKWESKGLETVELYISKPQAASYPLGAYPADFNEINEPGWGMFVWKVGTTSGGINLREGNAWTITISNPDNPEINDRTDGVFSILQCEG